MAVNCCEPPRPTLAEDGATAMLVRSGWTVSSAVATKVPEVAVTVADPVARAWASPWLPALLPMVAMVDGLALQVTVAVRVCVLPSEYVPVAANCCEEPVKTVALEGLIERPVSSGGAALTVRTVVPPMAPDVAVMVTAPAAKPCASPWLPAALPMVASAEGLALQVTVPVRFWILPSV